jgi:hypothetical protein
MFMSLAVNMVRDADLWPVRDKDDGRCALFPNGFRQTGFHDADRWRIGFCPLFARNRRALNRAVFNPMALDRVCVDQTSP